VSRTYRPTSFDVSSSAARISRKFSCVAYVPANPSRVAPSGT
jgi:hypothetical protein